MKKSVAQISYIRMTFLTFLFAFVPLTDCEAKIKAFEKSIPVPSCTKIGELLCPKGYKPDCPKQYKPSCVFTINKHLPACLEENPDPTVFTYNLKNITCEKSGLIKK